MDTQQTNNQNPQNNQNNPNTFQSTPPPATPTPTPTHTPVPTPAPQSPKPPTPKQTPVQIPKFTDMKKKNLIILGLAILVVLALVLGTRYMKKGTGTNEGTNEENLPAACLPGEQYDRNTGEPCVGAEDISATPASNSSYAGALKAYTGKTVLLGGDCAATPAEYNAPTGSRMLIGNNSTTTLEVAFQSRTTILRPYHYMLGSLKTAGEYPIKCNGDTVATVKTQ